MVNLRSRIFRGETTHKRLGPVPHAFTYPMTFFAFDPAEFERLDSAFAGFHHNRPGLLSLRDADFLDGEKRPIDEQLDRYLPKKEADERTLLVTSPRYLGYAFNPVNFHLRLRGDELLAAVAEVNNTFGDRHVYPLTDLRQDTSDTWTARSPKDFHVSPFNNMAGEYRFTFRIASDELFLGVDLHRDGACVMQTWLQGKGHPLTAGNLRRYALLHPFDTALNSFPRILWQAGVLHYKKRMQVYPRPSPESPHTVINRDRPRDAGNVI